jgi:hypothetical protein
MNAIPMRDNNDQVIRLFLVARSSDIQLNLYIEYKARHLYGLRAQTAHLLNPA